MLPMLKMEAIGTTMCGATVLPCPDCHPSCSSCGTPGICDSCAAGVDAASFSNGAACMCVGGKGTKASSTSLCHQKPLIMATAWDQPKLTVQLYKKSGDELRQHNIDKTAGVDNDMVVVGGGAVAKWTEIGALLTGSYPTREMNGWTGSSKDHMHTHQHELDVYALGLKVHGMTREELLNYMCVIVVTSPVCAHPEARAELPPDYLLLGGGAKVDWHGCGNLLTASYPSSLTSWTARSKDHEVSDPASLTVFAIGIRRHLPVGTVETHIQRVDSGWAPHPLSFANVQPGFTMTGGGAEAHWEGAGSLLWKLRPTQYGFEGGSKDHDISDPCVLSVYSIAMRIV